MKYVSINGNAMSKCLPSPNLYAKDITLRYPIYVPFAGERYKLKLDNFCGPETVKINKVTVSRTSSLNSEAQDDFVDVLFNGSISLEMKPGENIVSDDFAINVKSGEFLLISLYLKEYTNLTSGVDVIGPLSKGYFGHGDMSKDKIMDINKSKSISWRYFLSDVYAYTDDNNYSIICFGDSITSQDWPDYFQLALKEKGINNVAIIRKAVSGTRVLKEYDCITYQSYGLKGANRFNHEISSVEGAKILIIQHGINDIIHPVGENINIFRPMSDLPTSEELFDGIKYYLNEAKKYELEVYLGTLLPIQKWRTFSFKKEVIKNKFNKLILDNDKNIDFNKALGNKRHNCWKFKKGYDSGDHLHPSKSAYKKMGELACKIVK